ncbi:MAG: 4Fe-4S binding protein [Candidatus Poseidoniaceae archaeon]|nr:4Fe-4S binding protein [Candidatus Poseidoniaceae archaeon]
MVNFGFVIDNRTCIGCHACTVACKSEHDVPIGVNRTHVKYIEKGEYPNSTREFSVHRCNHCEDSPCATICPTSALYPREDGIVDFDDERCIGCKSCMQACPYDALYIDPNKGTAAKCNYCAHRIENSYEPACVVVCPTESIISGDLDNPNSTISQRIQENDVRVRKPESGAKPNLFYVQASDEMLDPAATLRTGSGMWTSQEGGVGHFAKYADNRLHQADTPSMIVQLALEMKAKDANPRDRAIIHDVMEKLGSETTPKATRSYDAPSKGILWDWEVAGYLVTKSAAAGLYILLMASILLGKLEFDTIVAIGIALSIALLGLTGALLIHDLDKPMRFIYVLLRPNWSSWLVRGGFTLGAFGALMTLHLAIFVLDLPVELHKWTAIAGIPAAWLTGSYTGWLFKQARGRVVWANKSNTSIILTGSTEMLFFGGLAFISLFIFFQQSLKGTFFLPAIAVSLIGFWFGYQHILHGLREAQAAPLL